MNHPLVEAAIKTLAQRTGRGEDEIRETYAQQLESLRQGGRLDAQTINIKERCRVEKFDHSMSDTPRLIETIEVDENSTRTVTQGEE